MNTQKKYKATFILDTRGYEEPVENLINKLKDIISNIGGNVTDSVNLGQKNFTRVVDKAFPNGIYIQLTVDGPTNLPKALVERLKLDRTVNRFMMQAI